MKWFLKTPATLAIFASWALGFAAHAQTNTQSYFAELNNLDVRDVAVGSLYTPYGDKNDLNRYGDDGAAAIVEASGMVIWRTSEGVYHPLPSSTYAKPLFVTNSECVVWRNAFNLTGKTDPETGEFVGDIDVVYFSLDSQTGALRETPVSLFGNKVMDTPVITTTTTPYTLVTVLCKDRATTTNVLPDPEGQEKNVYVYRLTHTPGTMQLLTATYLLEGYHDEVETVATAYDGSQIIRIADWDYPDGSGETWNLAIWIRPDGSYRGLFNVATDPIVVAWTAAGGEWAGGLFGGSAIGSGGPWPYLRVVELSASRLVLGMARYDASATVTNKVLYNYSRDPVSDQIQLQPTITLPFPLTTDVGEVMALPTYSQQGVDPVFATQDTAGNLNVFKLVGNAATHLYKAKIPAALGMDVAITRINNTPGSESIALRDQTNHGIIWLHNGPGYDQWEQAATTNYTRISRWKNDPVPAWSTDPYPLTNDMEWGRPLFVTPGEIVVWQNALAPILPNGSMPPVMIKHYGRNATTGAITTTEVKVLVDNTDPNLVLPGRIQGTQVFAPYPFTPSPELWMLETGQARSANSLRLRRYQLLTPTNADEDGDGIRGGSELGPYYVIPGSFTYDQAVEDARRRGGHLATISDAAEYSRMQTAIQLWRINPGSALPKLTVPYPLWTGLTNDGSSWQWTDGSPTTFINLATNWVGGNTSAALGRTSGRLTLSNLNDPTSAQQWEAANPNNLTVNGGGYLLELTPTDPQAKDTDGDYGSDYDELFRLITDPLAPNFFSPPGPPVTVPFSSTLVNGSYEGFLTEYGRGPIASFTLSVTNSGSYTARINGAAGSTNFRGSFNVNGAVIDLPVKIGEGLSTTLSMWIAPDPESAIYRVAGRLNGLNGPPLVFELRRAAYSKNMPTVDAGSYTLAIPASTVPKTGMPSGDGYLTGTIGKDGRAKFRGYSADGVALSWSGNLLEGEFMSFFSMFKGSEGFIGSNLFLRDSALYDYDYGLIGESDIDGDLLVMRKQSTAVAGYTYRSGAYGSIYQPVTYDQLPSFSDFTVGANNAILTFVDGAFSGQNVIATWTTKNAITIPKTQTRSLNAKINKNTGELSGTYNYNDPINNYANSKGTLAGVVLQKSGEVRGYYGVSKTYGQLVMLPNIDGSQAPVTLISPHSKSVSEVGATYKVYVTASEPWKVFNNSTWVVVQPTSGTGNAVLTVTVAGNYTNLRREANLTIAGLTHHIEQDWNRQGGGSVTITPAARAVSADGGTYTVMITGLTADSNAPFSSDVPWVMVTPSADLKSATVVVDEYWTWGYEPRSTVITIAGLPHTVMQSAWYWYYW